MSDNQENRPSGADTGAKPSDGGSGGGEQGAKRNSRNRNRGGRNRGRGGKRPDGGENTGDSTTEGQKPAQGEGARSENSGRERRDNRENRGRGERGERGERNDRNRRRNNKPEDAKGEGKPAEGGESGGEGSNRNNRNKNRNRRDKRREPAKDVAAAPVSEEIQQQIDAQNELYDTNFEDTEVLAYDGPVLENPVIGITCGDLNGIGMELIIKTLEDERITELCTPVVFASGKLASYHRNALEKRDFSFHLCDSIDDIKEGKNNLVEVWNDNVELNLGTPTDVSGLYALKSIDAAVEAAKAGKIHAVLTAPINKHNIADAVEGFSGHTGYLADAFGDEVLMILTSEQLRVATVTGHIPIAKVASSLTEEKVLGSLKILIQSLRRDFGLVRPKIAVLGLNPHAGEWGKIGTEERDVIAPAIEKASGKHALVRGPFPADGFFGQGLDRHFDAVLGMYHDQVLVPFKALAMGSGVNFTAGLSAVRTSPDHGTAMALAGKGVADESSLRTALFAAIDIWRTRVQFDEMTENPLKKQKKKD